MQIILIDKGFKMKYRSSDFWYYKFYCRIKIITNTNFNNTTESTNIKQVYDKAEGGRNNVPTI